MCHLIDSVKRGRVENKCVKNTEAGTIPQRFGGCRIIIIALHEFNFRSRQEVGSSTITNLHKLQFGQWREFLILKYNVPFYFGGTSLLIIVVVTMDFMAQVQNYLMSQQYESLLKKANFKTTLSG